MSPSAGKYRGSGALSARRPKIGASVPSLPAGARRRRREPPRDASRAEARRFGRSPRPLPSAENSVRIFFSEKEPERIAERECRESAVRLAGRSRWIGVFFPSKRAAARSRSVPLPVHPLRMSANVGNRRVCAAADRAAFPGRRADRRTQRHRDGFERCRQPGRVRTRAFSCGSAQRSRHIGKGRAGAVRRVADDADGSFTNGSNRESPATGPASGRGTGWG